MRQTERQAAIDSSKQHQILVNGVAVGWLVGWAFVTLPQPGPTEVSGWRQLSGAIGAGGHPHSWRVA